MPVASRLERGMKPDLDPVFAVPRWPARLRAIRSL